MDATQSLLSQGYSPTDIAAFAASNGVSQSRMQAAAANTGNAAAAPQIAAAYSDPKVKSTPTPKPASDATATITNG